MSVAFCNYSVEERLVQGETIWVAIRARGAEWSWLTPAEAATLGRQWVEKYGDGHHAPSPANNDDDERRQFIAAE